ncbi:MAG: transcriptional regulator [Lachnospiraceae bacterium]|nr:transcriptional regulator [Lachnospiraceae bacterium]
MKYYEKILDLKCFTLQDVISLVGGNQNTAKSLLRQYMQKGYIQSVKRNLYAAVSLETGMPVAIPYLIASCITPTSYVSHRSAFAYYGYTNQVSYEMTVSSDTPFRKFEFDGTTYRYISSRISAGVEKDGMIRVTDKERTTLDFIDDFDHIGGLEELLKGLEMMPYLSEDKLLHYLQLYDKAILYQKAGYVLEHFQESLKLSDTFFKVCSQRKGKSKRYFSSSMAKNNMVYNGKWSLMVPRDLLYISE